ncbi:hypothetical protein NL676_009212 [Syzygium grande]|nr:hypothetical protein NL676_009212 [Syzygium grande]
MVESKSTRRHKIMPIFYDVAPSEVKYQTEHFGEAIVSHAKKKRFDDETIDEWKAALTEVGALKGWDLHSNPNRGQGEFVKEVVSNVLMELKTAYLEVSDCLVEVDNHVDEIMRIIELPDEMGELESLMELLLDKTSIEEIPEWRRMKKLEILSLVECESLNKFSFIGCAASTSRLSSSQWRRFPTTSLWWIGRLRALEVLDLWSPYIATLSCDLVLLSQLKQLKLLCINLQCLPRLPTNLSYLGIQFCERIKTTNDLSTLKVLSNLKVTHCEKLTEIQGLECLENLRTLELVKLPSLTELHDLTTLKKLKTIHLWYCTELFEIRGSPESLEMLDIWHCSKLQKLPDPHQASRI